MVTTGDGELGFDSGEGAWETATTSKEGSRRANYPMPIRRGSDKKYQCRTQRVLRLEWEQFKNLNEEQLEGKSGEYKLLLSPVIGEPLIKNTPSRTF